MRLNCSNDTKSPLNRYHCLPVHDLTTLMEFCYNRTRPQVVKGLCMVYVQESNYFNSYNCTTFEDGCPDMFYLSDESYKYPKCMDIDRIGRCYLAESSCKLETTTSSDITSITRAVENSSSPTSTDDVVVIAISTSLGFLVLTCIVVAIIYKRRDIFCKRKDIDFDPKYKDPLLPKSEIAEIEREGLNYLLQEFPSDRKPKLIAKILNVPPEILSWSMERRQQFVESMNKGSVNEYSGKIRISPLYEETALDLENQLANLDGGYEILTTDMSKQGEQWHREIDIVINKMKTEIGAIKEKHRNILQKHLDEVKQIQSLIKQTILALNEIEKSTEVSSTIECTSKIREFSKPPLKVQISLPKFISKPIDREKLYSLFGQITPISTATEEKLLSLNQPNTSVRELLDEPKLVATIQTGFTYLRNVTCLNEERIWTCKRVSNIRCFNIKGSILQTIKTSGEVTADLAVDNDGGLLYSALQTSTVNKLKNGQPEELIRLQGWMPNQLCVTFAGDLLVTMYRYDATQSKVVRYSGSTEKQTIQFDGKGRPLYSGNNMIKYITENRNHDICVADCAARAVVVVNQDGKLRWRYTSHPSVTKNKPFQPYGITTDSQSHILTADFENHCIHILDQNGQFLRYIDNYDLKYPWGLCVDNYDNLFVCEFLSGYLKKIRYLK